MYRIILCVVALAFLAGVVFVKLNPISADEAPDVPNATNDPRVEQDDDDDDHPEAKSRIVRALLEWLDENEEDGADEERELIRDTLLEADDELHRSLGDNLKDKIQRANRKPPRIIVGPQKRTSMETPSTDQPLVPVNPDAPIR
jgi:hypothetical protein